MEQKIVLTSRIRLARNIADIPFPHKLEETNAEIVIDKVNEAIVNNQVNDELQFRLVRLGKTSSIKRMSMVEEHLISKEHANNYKNAAVLISEDSSISIMINEEDHIRLQVMEKGFDLKGIYETASKLDDILEDKLNFAYDNKLGYLTSCPTNLGTGIRASVMLHLPALTFINNMDNITETVNQVGMTIRGFYGEGSSAMGNIYQLSNQITLGLSEEEIINNIIGVTKKIISNEENARSIIIKKQSLELEDDIYRSLGMLKYTRLMTTVESLNLLSKVRMGIELGIISDIPLEDIDGLYFKVQPNTIQLAGGEDMNNRARDIARATIIRKTLGR